ncbi:MAG: ABC transporter permease, partial [Vicinamibacterales bacterium]|nr:ABC transporter permease [Vicinamibacterales bacterium]
VTGRNFNLGDDQQTAERISGSLLSADAFEILGERPILGRGFASEDMQPGAPPVALLGYELWQRRYAGDPKVLQRSVRVNGVPATVIGVMRPGMRFPFTDNLWVAASEVAAQPPDRSVRNLFVFGRLADGVTLEQARADLGAISNELARRFPDTNADVSATVMPFTELTNFGGMLIWVVQALMIGSTFVLLIGCAIVAMLLLARAVERASEVGTRLSLGATRGRIVRQLLVEGALLAGLGGGLGALLSAGGVAWLGVELGLFGTLPYWVTFSPEPRVVAFIAVVCLCTPLLFGLAPALHLARSDVLDVMQGGGRIRTRTREARRALSLVTVIGVALTVVLLTGTWSLVSSFMLRPPWQIGFDPAEAFIARFTMPAQRYPSVAKRLAFLRRLDDELATLPGIEIATTTTNAPLRSGLERRLEIDGADGVTDDEGPPVTLLSVGPRYFATLRSPLIRGRALGRADSATSARVVVINERLTELHFRGRDPLGMRIRLVDPRGGGTTDWLTVVGITTTVPQRSGGAPSDPVALVAHEANPGLPGSADVLVRTSAELGPSVTAVREAFRRLDADLPLYDVRTLAEQADQNDRFFRVVSSALLAVATIALVLVAIGLYAVTAYEVSRRTREIGIRQALGARAVDVRRVLLRRSIKLAAVGLLLGLFGGLAVGRIMGGLIPGAATDLLLLGPVSAMLLLVTAVACLVPARRANRLPPMAALRQE